MDNSSTLTDLEQKSSSLFLAEQQAKNKLIIGVRNQISRLPDYKQEEISSAFEHDLENDNLPVFANRVKRSIDTETEIASRYKESDSPYFHIITHIKDYLLEQGFIHAQVREIQQELISFLQRFYDTSQTTAEQVLQMDESLKQLIEQVRNTEVLVSGFQTQLQGLENRITERVRGGLSQDLQRLANLEGRVPQDLTTQLTKSLTSLGTLEGRIPDNFADTLQNNITNSVRATLPQNIVGQKTYWSGVIGAAVTIITIVTSIVGYGFFQQGARLSNVESDIKALEGRIDGLQNSLNGRLDGLQNLLLNQNQQTENNTDSPPNP